MTNVKEIGEIKVQSDHTVDWIIPKISCQVKDESYYSPVFSLDGSDWRFRIYPDGQLKHNSVGWISLFLDRVVASAAGPIGLDYVFGVKTAEGKVENVFNDCWLFGRDKDLIGHHKFLKNSELPDGLSELASTDTLTLTCTLRTKKSLNSSERLDALSRDLADFFISGKGCDIKLRVDTEEFSAHKFILSARSPYIAEILEQEEEDNKLEILSIGECNPETFRNFLNYLYTGKIENLSNEMFQLYKIARIFKVKELESDCLICILSDLSQENVLDAVKLGHQMGISALQLKTQKFFNQNFREIVSNPSWQTFMKANSSVANKLLIDMAPYIQLKQ